MAPVAETFTFALQHHQAGRLQEAEALYRQILQAQPNHSDALHLLGVIAHQVGKHEIAVEYITRAIALNPTAAEYHSNIGEAYRALARLNEAEASFQQALALKPASAEAMNNLGAVLQAQDKLEAAVAHYQRALALKPNYAEAHNNLGTALHKQGRSEGAIAQYQQAIALKPDYPEAYNNLGFALQGQGQLEEAVVQYRQALVFKPTYPEAHNNLGNALKAQGKLAEAVVQYRQALAFTPNDARLHSKMIFVMSYDPATTVEAIATAHREWNDRYARSVASHMRPHQNDRNPERRLRVGYVSADFWGHAVGYFIEPLLASHNRTNVMVFAYSNGVHADATTKRLRQLTDGWRDIVGTSDDSVAGLIREDGIDILVDLSGHTLGNRLLVFARKPAPVQVTYLGYGTTTGLSTMDYRLTDQYLSPSDSREWCSEELIRLQGCFSCYRPSAEAPAVAPSPASTTGHVTFGSFNNLAKVTPVVVGVWAEILRAVPQAELILKDATLADTGQQARYRALFAANGIAGERIKLIPRTATHDDHLALYSRVDIGLDPFPYNGGTTTCDALWMGVPVITLAGCMSYSRFGVSFLSNLGLEDLVAATPETYVAKAMGLAKDLVRMADLRSQLRPRMAASTLCDAEAFAHGVEEAYRLMWRRWCRSPLIPAVNAH